jgi:hypothetical protein
MKQTVCLIKFISSSHPQSSAKHREGSAIHLLIPLNKGQSQDDDPHMYPSTRFKGSLFSALI